MKTMDTGYKPYPKSVVYPYINQCDYELYCNAVLPFNEYLSKSFYIDLLKSKVMHRLTNDKLNKWVNELFSYFKSQE